MATIVINWPEGEVERQTAVSIPLADLSPPDGLDLAGAASSGDSVPLPYIPTILHDNQDTRLLITDTSASQTLGRTKVVTAAFDPQRQVYSVALESPERILTWTPASAPGTESPTSTTLPEHRSEGSIYEGASLTPVQAQVESYPAFDLSDQDRIIITFPADSGMAPILVMFKDRRMGPGTVTGVGQLIEGVWLGEAARGSGAAVPAHIADQLRGRHFNNFSDFREAFWKAIANDEHLSKQFSKKNIESMKNQGYAPAAVTQDHYKSHIKFILHHATPVSEGGGVYDLDNIRIVTPANHQKIHYGERP